MDELNLTSLLLSSIITWTIGLTPPVLIRFVFVRKAMEKKIAIAVCVLFWIINYFLFIALGSKSKTHAALYLIAIVSYGILNKGFIDNRLSSLKIYPAIKDLDVKEQINKLNDELILLPIDSPEASKIRMEIKRLKLK